MKRIIALVATLALAACGQVGDEPAVSTTSTQPSAESTPTAAPPNETTTTTTTTSPPESTTTTVADGPGDDQPLEGERQYPESEMADELLDAIIADAAERTGVDAESVEIVSIAEETFNDASLGCPKKGESYIQVITPGRIVMVQAGSTTFEYHASESGSFVLCQ